MKFIPMRKTRTLYNNKKTSEALLSIKYNALSPTLLQHYQGLSENGFSNLIKAGVCGRNDLTVIPKSFSRNCSLNFVQCSHLIKKIERLLN